MNAAKPSQLPALTGIRGIAAWLVVLYHVRPSLTGLLPRGVIDVLAHGYLAVDMFFVLSGFVMWHTYAHRIAQGGSGEIGRFLWRRFARVWPLHGAILAAFMALAALLALTGRDTSGYPWGELPLHILLLQNWGFTSALSWNHPAWSISTEMAAYIVFPALVPIFGRHLRTGAARLAAIAVLLFAEHALFAAHGLDSLGADIPGLGVWRCLLAFSTGCVVCMVWSARGAGSRIPLVCLPIAAALAAAWRAGVPETLAVPALMVCALLALAGDGGTLARVLGSPALRWLGEISYATYLSHFLLFILFKIAFVGPDLQIGWMGLYGFLALLLAASAALYHGLEKPAQRWLNRRAPFISASQRGTER